MSQIPPADQLVRSLPQATPSAMALTRLSQAARLRDVDSADVSSTNDRLEGLRARLAEASALVERAARGETSDVAAIQRELDVILGDVNRAARTSTGGLHEVRDVAPSIASLAISNSTLAAGEAVDVEIVALQSAARGGLLLSFGNAQLDLGAADSQFTIEIGGANGSQELTFASGTTLASLAAAINSFASQTGVAAEVDESNTAIALRSDFGSDAFVSVDIIDDGGIQSGEGVGVFRPQDGNKNFIDADSGVAFGDADGPIVDAGQTLEAIVNGRMVTGEGPSLSVSFEKFDAVITFWSDPFRSLGGELQTPRFGAPLGEVFRAFQVVGLDELPERDGGQIPGAVGPPGENRPAPSGPADIREALLADPGRGADAAGGSALERIIGLLE